MSIRAVLLGLLGAVLIAGLTYVNDWVLRQTALISHNLPFSVFGTLVVFVLVFNPLLFRLRKRWALSGAEIAVALSLTLAACAIPGSGLLRTFIPALVMPHQYAQTEVGWKGDRPNLSLAEVESWTALGRGLSKPEESQLPRVVEAVRARLPEETSEDLRTLSDGGKLPIERRRRLLAAINEVLHGINIDAAIELPLDEAPDHVRTRLEWQRKEIRYVRDLLASLPDRLDRKSRLLREARQRLAPKLKKLEELRAKEDEMARSIRPELDALREQRADEEITEEEYHHQRLEIERPLDDLKGRIAVLEAETRIVDRLTHELKVLRTALATGEDGRREAGETERALNRLVLRNNRLLLDAALPKAVDERSAGAVEMAPPRLLADLYINPSDALGGYVRGLAIGDDLVPAYRIPWEAWERPLWFWLPIILSLWFGLVALAVVVHRQWATHELLPYPVAIFTDSLLPAPGEARGGVFSNPLFWIGAGAVFFIHMNNFLVTWFPGWIKIPTEMNLWPLAELMPTVSKGGGWFVFNAMFFFTPLAFAYFLSTDVSLSLAVGPVLFVYIIGLLSGYGYSIGRAGSMSLDPASFLGAGAYLGIFCALVYAGRRYYMTVFGRALFLPMGNEVESRAVWAARVFIVALAVFVGNLVTVGLDWQLALLYAIGICIIYLVMSRIIAETGLFFIQAFFSPCMVLVSVLGAQALGPETMILLFLITVVLKIDPRESLMPFMINNLKIMDLQKVRYGRASVWCAVAVVVALAVAIPVTLYFQYNYSGNNHGWMFKNVPQTPFKEVTRLKRELVQTNMLQASRSVSGWQRFAEAVPRNANIIAMAVGLGLTILFSAGRLRFPKWPLHPVLFLVWTTYPATRFAWSFFAGWLIKVLVMKYGGNGAYNRLKPLMFGLIAGDMLGGLTPAAFSWVYYALTGDIPKSYNIMPV